MEFALKYLKKAKVDAVELTFTQCYSLNKIKRKLLKNNSLCEIMKKEDGTGGYVYIAEACRYFGVSQSTMRRWTKENRVKWKLSPTGRRLIKLSEDKKKESKVVAFYSRVSSHKQRDDLQRQKQYIVKQCPTSVAQYESCYFQDIASGLNFKRRGLIALLERVQKGDVYAIVVASKDRLARFGYELIEWICDKYGTRILVLEHNDNTPTEELGKDLLSIVQVYCCKWNGQRRYKDKSKEENKTAKDD